MIHEQYKAILTDTGAAQRLARRVLTEGSVALDTFVDADTRATLVAFSRDAHNAQQQKGRELHDSAVGTFALSDELFAFCQALHDARVAITGEPRIILRKEKQVIGTPYKNARDTQKNEVTDYHYDGAYVNLTLPLILPPNPSVDGGNLILFPNLRRRYSGLFCKVLSRMLRHSAWFRKVFGFTVVEYRVGALNLFFGDLSFHGVEPLRNGERLVITVNSHW